MAWRWCFLCLTASASAVPLTKERVLANNSTLWSSFKQDFGRVYNTGEEEASRYATFQDSLLKAVELQDKNPLAEFGVTKFSDYTDQEFKQLLGLRPALHPDIGNVFSADVVSATLAASPSIDWRSKGVVVPVKDQGDCGGCWAFASAANIESVWAIAGNPLTSLSEQQFLACDDYFPCTGCSSGEMSCAFLYLTDENKEQIDTEKSYPYTAGASGKEGSCKKSGATVGATISGQKDLPTDEAQMAAWIAQHGPIAIGAHADPWKQYKSGILTDCGSGAVDHAIVIVGYGTESGQDYWLIRNSWGTSFGESGYIRIGRGSNVCQIKSQPTTAVVSKEVVV